MPQPWSQYCVKYRTDIFDSFLILGEKFSVLTNKYGLKLPSFIDAFYQIKEVLFNF